MTQASPDKTRTVKTWERFEFADHGGVRLSWRRGSELIGDGVAPIKFSLRRASNRRSKRLMHGGEPTRIY